MDLGGFSEEIENFSGYQLSKIENCRCGDPLKLKIFKGIEFFEFRGYMTRNSENTMVFWCGLVWKDFSAKFCGIRK